MRRIILVLLFPLMLTATLQFYEPAYEDGLLYKSMAFDVTPKETADYSAAFSLRTENAQKQGSALPEGTTTLICEILKDGATSKCNNAESKTALVEGKEYRILYEWRGVALTDDFDKIDLIPTFEGKEYPEYAWWNVTYNNQTEVTASTESGTTRENYQVNLTLQDNGYMDFGISIRFANASNEKELPFWVDYANSVNGSYYSVWVKVDANITTTGYTFYLYSGNTTNVGWASNPQTVFDLYDDFPGNALNTSKWAVDEHGNGGSVSVGSGYASIVPFYDGSAQESSAAIRDKFGGLTNGYLFEANAKGKEHGGTTAYYAIQGFTQDEVISLSGSPYFLFAKYGYENYIGKHGSSGHLLSTDAEARWTGDSDVNYGAFFPSSTHATEWGVWSISLEYDGTYNAYFNYVQEGTAQNTSYTNNNKSAYIGLGLYYLYGAMEVYVDWARVRQYHDDDVFVALGASENKTLNTTWVSAVDELPVNATIFSNGSTVGLQGYCASNGTLINASALIYYYPNNTFVQTIANTSGLTNATSYNWSFTTPAQSLNYSWSIYCEAQAEESYYANHNSSGRYFLTNLPAPAPSPAPSPSPEPELPVYRGEYVGDYQVVYDVRERCLPFKLCVPFTDYCLTLWSVCENEPKTIAD